MNAGGTYTDAETQALQKITAKGGTVGKHAAEYIFEHGARVIVDPLMSSRNSAQWRVDGNIYLPEVDLDTENALAGIVHEAKHLEQGSSLARSVLGELEAWQVDFTFRGLYTGRHYAPNSAIGRLLSYSVSDIADRKDRELLRTARSDMLEAAPSYIFIYLYPLLPSEGFARIVDWLAPRVLDPLQHAISKREQPKDAAPS